MPTWDPARLDPACYPGPGSDLLVMFADLDLNMHLNNVAAGRFFEHARGSVFSDCGMGKVVHDQGGRFFVVRVSIDYLHEVQVNQTLHIRTRFVAVGRSSMRVEQGAWVEGRCVLLSEVVFAHAKDGGSAPWPPAAREMIERLVEDSAALRPA